MFQATASSLYKYRGAEEYGVFRKLWAVALYAENGCAFIRAWRQGKRIDKETI